MKRAALLTFLAVVPFFLSCGRAPEPVDSAESVFNAATEAMVKGDDPSAIMLYYSLVNDYPSFKGYKSDIYYRLGTLLYKTERYDEAEKIFVKFSEKFGGDSRLKNVYEKLINIYVQEFHDDAKAQKIRDAYAKKFGGTPTLQAIDNTINVLQSEDSDSAGVLALDASSVLVEKLEKSASLDRDVFPVCGVISAGVKSPDGKFYTEIKKNYLYYGAAGERSSRIPESRGASAPQWSWDSRFVVFTTAAGRAGPRHIKVYDSKKGKTSDIFWAKGVSPMLAVSPDPGTSKIIFCYNSRLWIINRDGSSVSLLDKHRACADPGMMAWSKDGGKLIFSRKNDPDTFYICSLGRRYVEDLN
jgi:hypothetical protein